MPPTSSTSRYLFSSSSSGMNHSNMTTSAHDKSIGINAVASSPIRRETEESVSDPSVLYRVLLKEEELRNRSLANENGALKAEVRVLQERSRANVFSRLDASRQHQQHQHRVGDDAAACCVPNCYRNRSLQSTARRSLLRDNSNTANSSATAVRGRSFPSPQRSQSARPVARRSSLVWTSSGTSSHHHAHNRQDEDEYVSVPLVSPTRSADEEYRPRSRREGTNISTSIMTSPPRKATDNGTSEDRRASPRRQPATQPPPPPPAGPMHPHDVHETNHNVVSHVTSLSPLPHNPKLPKALPVSSPTRGGGGGAVLSPHRSPLRPRGVVLNASVATQTYFAEPEQPPPPVVQLPERSACTTLLRELLLFVMQDDVTHGRRSEQDATASHITFEDSSTLALYQNVRTQIFRLKRRVVSTLNDMSQLQHMVSMYQDTAAARTSAAHEAAMHAMSSGVDTVAQFNNIPPSSSRHHQRGNNTTGPSLRSSRDDLHVVPPTVRPSSSYAFTRPAIVNPAVADGSKLLHASVDVERNPAASAPIRSGVQSLSSSLGGTGEAEQQRHILCQHDRNTLFEHHRQQQGVNDAAPLASAGSPSSRAHYPPNKFNNNLVTATDVPRHATTRPHRHSSSPSRRAKEVWLSQPTSHNQSATSITMTNTDDDEGGGVVQVPSNYTTHAAMNTSSTSSAAATSSKAALMEAIRAANGRHDIMPSPRTQRTTTVTSSRQQRYDVDQHQRKGGATTATSASLRLSGSYVSGGGMRRSVDPLDVDQLLSASTVYSPSQHYHSPQQPHRATTQPRHQQPRPLLAHGHAGGGMSVQNSLTMSDASMFSTLNGGTDLERYLRWKADFTERLSTDVANSSTVVDDILNDGNAQRFANQGRAATGAPVMLHRYQHGSTEGGDEGSGVEDDAVNLSSPTY